MILRFILKITIQMCQHKMANQTHKHRNIYYHDTSHPNHKEMNACTNTNYANYQIMQTLHTNVKAQHGILIGLNHQTSQPHMHPHLYVKNNVSRT